MFDWKKFDGKCKGKKLKRKDKRKENNKNKFKINKLFLYIT